MPDYTLSDIATAVGSGPNGNNGNGFGNDGGWWILLLFILLGGFNGNRGYGGGGAGGVGGNELYPWLNNADQINGGYRDQMIQTTLQGIQTQGQSLATQLCNCCGDMQMALCNGFNGVNTNLLQGFAGVEQGANTRQVANMQQAFQQQLATQQGFNGVQGQLAQQTATILAENCADRAAFSDGVRDIIADNGAMTQLIIDKLCQLELDGVKRQVSDRDNTIAQLRADLTAANFAASQQAQNAYIQQGFANEVDALYNRLSNCPVPSMPVYGRTPIFTCQPQNPDPS